MRKVIKSLYQEERGSALVLFTLMFALILGIAGLVIDAGVLYNTRSHLQKAANAAALSGAQELINSADAVKSVVGDILQAHGENGSLKKIDIRPDNSDKLQIVLEKDVPLYFMKLFKINSIKVSAAAAAGLVPMNRGKGAVPLGIDDSIPLEYMKAYSLKVDSGSSTYGNFGILALSGPGAKLYEQDLQYGYDGEIQVGDIIDTQTGNIEGKTRDAISARIAACPYSSGDINERDCPRIVMILVYKPYNVQSNQLKQVKVTGFAYFYIKEPMDTHDSSITGYFIRRAGGGIGSSSSPDKGAYAIRLTE